MLLCRSNLNARYNTLMLLTRRFLASLVPVVLVTLLLLFSGCGRSKVSPSIATTAAPAAEKPLAPSGIAFESVAEAAGIRYRWPQQPRPMRNIEAFGVGCAFLDFDDDG